ncbi:hypothetical protein PLESTM_000679500 [Pleodorina starrii]|nr:hypothetical protein PLESTM_000679500 [Pleodorina starrii]
MLAFHTEQCVTRVFGLLHRRPPPIFANVLNEIISTYHNKIISGQSAASGVSFAFSLTGACTPFSTVQAPWSPPVDEWESRRAKQAQRSQAAALQRIRNCCTFEELVHVLPRKGSSPDLLVRVAQQAPRVLEWPLSTADRRRLAALLETLTQQCAMNMEEYDISHLAGLMGACSRARFVPGDLLLPLQHRLEADAREGRIQDEASAGHLAALAGALSHLRLSGGPGGQLLWGSLGAAAESCVHLATLADISRLLAAFARADQPNKSLWGKAVVAALRTIKSAQPQDVALLMRCLAWAARPPGPDLLPKLAAHLNHRASEYEHDLPSLAELAGAVSELRIRDRDLYDMLAELGTRAMRRRTAVLLAPVIPGLPPPLHQHQHRPPQRQPGSSHPGSTPRGPTSAPQQVTGRTVLTLVRAVSRELPPGRHPHPQQQALHPLLLAASDLMVALARRAAAEAGAAAGVLGEAGGADGGSGGELDLECVEGLAAVLAEAGLEGERGELLRKVSSLAEAK